MTIKPPEDLSFLPVLDPNVDLNNKEEYPNYEGTLWEGLSKPLKESDPLPEYGNKTYSAIFCLNKPEHLAYYNAVWQLVNIGVGHVQKEIFEHEADGKTWHVFLRWYINYAYNR